MNLFPGIKQQKWISVLFSVFCFTDMFSQSLIINEVSNGPSGNKEYIELVVVDSTAFYSCTNTATPCIDIRGWIIDDNSGYHGTGGIATGANRFSQDALWSCVPLGTIILVYNDADVNADIPAVDLVLNDGNCNITAPISNTSLFETNTTTPGAIACSYPPSGWISGGDWASTLLANSGDCARIVDLNGCEVFSLCWATQNLNNQIYFNSGLSGSDNVWYFNDGDPNLQINWSEGCTDLTSCGTNEQTPGAPNNLLNQNYIAQFNNNCSPISPIVVSVVSTNAGCTCDGTAEANASGSIPNYTYEWYDNSFSNSIGNGFTISGLCSGTYHVIATSLIGCSDTATVIISNSGSVPIAIPTTVSPVCEGDTIFLFGNFISGATYQWSGPNGFSSTQQNPEIFNATQTDQGNYSLIVSTGICSSSSVNVFVQINPLPIIPAFSNSPVCMSDTIILSASSSGASNFIWTGPNSFSSNGTNAEILNATILNNGIYTVSAELNGCGNSTAINVIVTNPATTTITPQNSICANQTSFNFSASPSGGVWSGPGITNSSLGTFDPLVSGIGTHEIIYSFNSSCILDDTLLFVVNPLPIANAGLDENFSCEFSNMNLNGTASSGNSISFNWTIDFGNIISGLQTNSPIISTPGIYILTVTDANGCLDSDTVEINFTAGPNASFIASPTTGTLPFEVNIQNNSSGNGNLYLWTTCEGEISNLIEPVFDMDSVGNCMIELIVTDSNGCSSSSYQFISAFDEHYIYVPNIFSPNGDSSNEMFLISGEGIFDFHLEIFNRWGTQLFTSENISNSWDGNFENKEVPEGTYYFILKVEYANADSEIFNGSLTLLRN